MDLVSRELMKGKWEMKCGTCLLGGKVFDTAKYAYEMRGVVAGCTVQEFAHQSSFIGPMQQRYSNKLIMVQLRCKCCMF